MRLKIMLDLDGVIYDWLGAAINVFDINPLDPHSRKILKSYHDSIEMLRNKQEVLETIEGLGAAYWENLKLLPWAIQLYDALIELGDVTILTSPGSWTYAGRGKILALKRDFDIKNFILAKKKEVCAAPNAILIDDKKKNIAKFRDAGGWAYRWPNSFCIYDNEPPVEEALANCLDYVKAVRTKVADRKTNQIMDLLCHDNNRDEDMIER